MKAMNAHITLGSVVIRRPNRVAIERGWKFLTDRATITLPMKSKDFKRQAIKTSFPKGTPVNIQLGYDGELHEEFTGYITHVAAGIPLVIQCEDEMWKLKQIPVNISLKETSLKNLLAQIVTGYAVEADAWDLGPVRYSKTTVAQVLEKLRQNYGLYSFMRGKTLVCGKSYTGGKTIPLHLERDLVNERLNYRSAKDIRIRIEAVSTLRDGRKIEVSVGDSDGELRRLTYFGIEVEGALKKLAEQDLKKFKVDGLEGGLTTFGIPVIQHGDKVDLTSDLYAERNGQKYVEETRVSFDENGYRRNLKLGEKA